MHRDNNGISSSPRLLGYRLLRLSCRVGIRAGELLVIDVVHRLKVEKALAHVAPHIGLIAVETQPLAAAF